MQQKRASSQHCHQHETSRLPDCTRHENGAPTGKRQPDRARKGRRKLQGNSYSRMTKHHNKCATKRTEVYRHWPYGHGFSLHTSACNVVAGGVLPYLTRVVGVGEVTANPTARENRKSRPPQGTCVSHVTRGTNRLELSSQTTTITTTTTTT